MPIMPQFIKTTSKVTIHMAGRQPSALRMSLTVQYTQLRK